MGLTVLTMAEIRTGIRNTEGLILEVAPDWEERYPQVEAFRMKPAPGYEIRKHLSEKGRAAYLVPPQPTPGSIVWWRLKPGQKGIATDRFWWDLPGGGHFLFDSDEWTFEVVKL